MRTVETAVANCVTAVWRGDNKQATKYISPKFVVKATRRVAGTKRPRATDNVDIVLTLGSPNYADRLYIKQCVKAGEPFPVKKLRFKSYPVARKPAKVRPLTKGVRSLAAKVLGQTRQRRRG